MFFEGPPRSSRFSCQPGVCKIHSTSPVVFSPALYPSSMKFPDTSLVSPPTLRLFEQASHAPWNSTAFGNILALPPRSVAEWSAGQRHEKADGHGEEKSRPSPHSGRLGGNSWRIPGLPTRSAGKKPQHATMAKERIVRSTPCSVVT
ncbi:hypothetical protein CPSG_09788 [Coccidioides posadasii str. Silveira]|uniref:Uncharacterized protein n=1 Tax=Coccidioides posadasii (strain RMSCC 757 / Silveira) TaxID=443226 RepID=E9DIY9_COCPS|nr:hypothetical protein CPSG_09788 [Coccidioides posadasii str. Silveira]